METRFVLIFCILILVICDDRFVIGARGSGGRSRGTSHRTVHRPATHSHSSSGGGHFWSNWFNWGGSSSSSNGGATASARKSAATPPVNYRSRYASPPTSHASFSNYGKAYEANFHNVHSQRQYTPVPHPYQRHFHPQTTDVFAYHFVPHTHIHHHVHHYAAASRSEPVYYDYNSTVPATPNKEPIIYDYSPPAQDLASDEKEINAQAGHANDMLIIGMENVLSYGNLIDNQHQILFLEQASDGISLENELLMAFDNFGASENLTPQYFPDVEFRFDADDDPNDDDISEIYRMYKDLVADGRC